MSHALSHQYESATQTVSFHRTNRSQSSNGHNDEFIGKLIHASVLVVDFHDAAAHLTAELAPTALEELSVFYTVMQQIVLEHGGRISRCSDNAFIALFGAPLPNLSHAQQAANVAMEMLTRLSRINGRRLARKDEPLRIGFGVNTGEMIIGRVEAQYWHHETVLGHTVKTAVALSHTNKRTPIHTVFVGSETAAALRLQHNWYLANLGAVSNNGSSPLDVHALVLLKN